MTEPTEAEVKQEIARLLKDAGHSLHAVCRNHESSPAQAACAHCGSFFCWGCMQFDTEQLELCCAECRTSRQRQRQSRNVVTFLREPFFYVGLAVAVTMTAYFLGIGNITAAEMLRQDRGKMWHQQRVPTLWLRQAWRARKRMEYLASEDRQAEKQKWAKLTGLALSQAATIWQDQKVWAELRLAEAIMLAEAGDLPAAYTMLSDLQEEFAAGSRTLTVWRYYRGSWALKLDKIEEASRYWSLLLAEKTPGSGAGKPLHQHFEEMIDSVLADSDLHEQFIERMTAAVSGTERSLVYYQRRTATEAVARNLELHVSIPAELLPQAETVQKKGALVIKRRH